MISAAELVIPGTDADAPVPLDGGFTVCDLAQKMRIVMPFRLIPVMILKSLT